MIDPLLRTLVITVEHSPHFRPWVTVTVPGMLVSGHLISADEYARRSANLPPDKVDETIQDTWLKLATRDGGSFVHMEEARFFMGSTTLPEVGHGFLWRARLDDVLGMSVGALTKQGDPYPPAGAYPRPQGAY